MQPLIVKQAAGEADGSLSEVRIICRDGNGRELDRILVKLGSDESVILPLNTDAISIIPVIDLDI